MKTRATSRPVLSAAYFIISRTLLYAALWFACWTGLNYFTTPEGFRPRVSSDHILLTLFFGWLAALTKWKVGGDKGSADRKLWLR
jgi:hypothetical protein